MLMLSMVSSWEGLNMYVCIYVYVGASRKSTLPDQKMESGGRGGEERNQETQKHIKQGQTWAVIYISC